MTTFRGIFFTVTSLITQINVYYYSSPLPKYFHEFGFEAACSGLLGNVAWRNQVILRRVLCVLEPLIILLMLKEEAKFCFIVM